MNRYSTERFVSGGGDLQAALAAIRGDAEGTMVIEAVESALHPITDAMRNFAPVKSGEYRASITEKVVSKEKGRAVGLAGPSGRAARKAHLLEFGHLAVAPRKGQTIRRGNAVAARDGHTHVPAHPHIRPAVITTLGAQASAFRSSVESSLRKRAQ